MNRYWELDAFRGFWVLCMIVFHAFFIMVFFSIADIDLFDLKPVLYHIFSDVKKLFQK